MLFNDFLIIAHSLTNFAVVLGHPPISKFTSRRFVFRYDGNRGLTLKLLRTIPSKDMVKMLLVLITKRRFTVHIGADNSRCRTLKNGIPQGSVLAPALFNLYTYDLPPTTSKKYVYADDIAMSYSHTQLKVIEKN